MTIRHRREVALFYTLTFLANLTFTLPIWVIFGTGYLHLSVLQTIVVLSSPQFLIGALLQVPGGAWADRHGRRRSYLLGTALGVLGYVPFLVTKDFGLLCLTIPVAGAGIALCGGSLEAIMSEVAEEDPELHFKDIAANGMTTLYVARVVGSSIGGLLYAMDPRAPMAAAAVVGLAQIAMAVRLPEVRHRRAGPARLSEFVRLTTSNFNSSPDIWGLLVLLGAHSIVAEMVWLALQPAIHAAGVSFALMGVVYALLSLISAAGGQLARPLASQMRTGTIITMLLLSVATTAIGLLLLPGWTIVFATVPMQLSFGIALPVSTTYVAARTPNEVRATSLSFCALFQQLATMISWLIAAPLLDHGGTTPVFVTALVASLVFASVVSLFHLRENAAAPQRTLGVLRQLAPTNTPSSPG